MFYEIKTQAVYITIKIKPNAKESKVLSISENFLSISIKAPPIDNKANEMLIDFLSDLFSVTKKEVEIVRGKNARLKRIKLPLRAVDVVVAIGNENNPLCGH